MKEKEKSLSKYSIIPKPVKITPEDGVFIIDDKTTILTDSKLKKNAEFLKQLLSPATGFNLSINNVTSKEEDNNVIILKIIDDHRTLDSEGYILQVSHTNVNISATSPSGVFYGIQTLRQLLPPEIESSSEKNLEWAIPCVKIEDNPRFSWRGFMLDESRHFFGKEEVMKILDQMAFLKLNVFHWHLTDDQGWRIEIKKYPLLTEVGSKRKGTIVNKRTGKTDGIPISGYYSQKDLKDIINYAAERFITVVPEIDLPGHTTAVIASHPELSCTGGPFEVSTRFGIHKNVLCVGKEKTFDVVKDILSEVMEIFPSEIIHTGGDEVPKIRWKKCSDCQTRIKNEGIENEVDLQVYFTNRIAKYLASHGHRLMGWNEILNDNLVSNAICQYWTANFNIVLEHIRKSRDVVISEMSAVYLNYPYDIIPLQKTYEYDPIPEELEEKFHKQILGFEACLWTEYVADVKRLEWQVFPRLTAVAETGWTPKKKKNFQSFSMRLDPYLKRLSYYNINHFSQDEFDK